MPHRSTKWRWKKRGRRPISLNVGRRLKEQEREKRIRASLVQLTKREFPGFSIFLDLWDLDGIPLDLVAVVAHDLLGFGWRTRKPNKKKRSATHLPGIVKMLLYEAPYLSKQQAEAFVKDNPEWLKHFNLSDRPISRSGRRIKRFGIVEGSPCCISKVFPHISRRMVCYWRKHAQYKEVVRDFDTLKPSPIFRSAPSTWDRAPFFR
jgi:hypothetical protein